MSMDSNYSGLFISLEGGEGSGKTTLAQKLKQYFEEMGHTVLLTREPGGAPLSEKIRDLLIGSDVTEMDPLTETLLYAASRREHLTTVILPALKSGHIVISDRYVDSSVVYQGRVRGVGWTKVFDINTLATTGIMPHLTLLLDIAPSLAQERIQNNERIKNRFDKASLSFHESVQKEYLNLAKIFPKRIKKLDANESAEYVFSQAIRKLKDYEEQVVI